MSNVFTVLTHRRVNVPATRCMQSLAALITVSSTWPIAAACLACSTPQVSSSPLALVHNTLILNVWGTNVTMTNPPTNSCKEWLPLGLSDMARIYPDVGNLMYHNLACVLVIQYINNQYKILSIFTTQPDKFINVTSLYRNAAFKTRKDSAGISQYYKIHNLR